MQRRQPWRADVRAATCSCGAKLTLRSRSKAVDAHTRVAVDFIARLESGVGITHEQVANGAAKAWRACGSFGEAGRRGFPRTQMQRIVADLVNVELNTLVALVVRSETTLKAFLSAPPAGYLLRPTKVGSRAGRDPRPAVHGKTARVALHQLLQTPERVTSMTAFCREQRVSQLWLRRSEPVAYKALVAASKRNRRQRAITTRQATWDQIEREIRASHARHGRLNQSRLNTDLSRPGLLRDRRYRAAAKRLIKQLG